MSIIRKATGLDTDDIKKIYECAFYGIEGIVESYFKFDEYVEFCLKHRFSYVAMGRSKEQDFEQSLFQRVCSG
ncbi:hypothetical protein [Mediterraneibacter gnavus]|uniref:hypothetical protein n=1 Tax=Mediterraneibacter gnavus TaxID=33038 RepID=UPI000E467E60|nr:hypothetical protein DW671_07760 [Mediterraneibacter gnavus]